MLATVSRLLAVLEDVLRVCPACIIILLPAIYSNDEPEGIGIFFAKNTLESALSLMSAVIWLDVVLANVNPITTVVVLDGVVYSCMSASADVVEPSYTLFLKVLAIYFSPLCYVIY